ncbi:unnamed protein product [Linum trigynum]|uniref:Uncharacterized protein n=1 Tax=Linum trigynum TaxID=586398 RepID=A0AAV2GCV9_9ROSI
MVHELPGHSRRMWFEENTLAGLFVHLCLLLLIFFIQLAAYDLGLFDGMVACLFGKIVAIREKEPKWAKIVMCILAAMVLLRDFLLKVLRQQAWRRRNAGTGGGDDQA